jgi:alpha-glucosidase
MNNPEASLSLSSVEESTSDSRESSPVLTVSKEDREELVLSQIGADEDLCEGINARYFKPLETLLSWERTVTGVTAIVDDCRLELDFVDDDVLRIAISPIDASSAPETFAVVRENRTWSSDFVLQESDHELRLSSNRLTVAVDKSPFKIELFRPDGSPVLTCPVGNGIGNFAQLNDQFVLSRKRPSGSVILGLGQKTGEMDRSERRFTLWNTDVLNPRSVQEFGARFPKGDLRRDPRSREFDPYYISIPFYYSLDREGRAAGFFIDNLNRAEFDFAQPEETRIGFAGGGYVEYVFAGPDLKEILRRYTGLTGRMQSPPLWSLGYHHCRWHPYSADDVVRHARGYRERKIPCDSIWLDIDHMSGYRAFTWNPKLFPDPARLVADLKIAGMRIVTIVDPGVKVEPGNPVYESGKKRGLFCVTERGSIYHGQVWPGITAFPDYVNKEARDWWGDLNAQHVSLGLAGIWNDMNEPATGDVPDGAMRFDRGRFSHGNYHNGYATLMAMATHEGLTKAQPDSRPFVLSRAGSAGIQRYSANWLGDNMSRWDHLRMSVPMALGLGLSGQPFVGSDIGGFGENCDPQLLVRWMQAACLSPFCRNHNDAGGVDQYPWSFGPEVEEICRQMLQLRYRLMPYLYSSFVQSAESGSPVMRPMIWESQTSRAGVIGDQFMVGPHLLVAPVLEKDTVQRRVWIPDGEWIDFWTGLPVEPGWIDYSAPIDCLPLFVKAGAVLPMWPESPPSTLGYHPGSIDLKIFVPNGDGTFLSRLVEDDGESFGYRRGERLSTEIELTRAGHHLRVGAKSEGATYPQFRRTEFHLSFPGAQISGPVIVPAGAEGFEWEVSLS